MPIPKNETAFIAFKYSPRQKNLKELRTARITVEELRQKLDAVELVVIFELRFNEELQLDPAPASEVQFMLICKRSLISYATRP
jgi:hypothetical protein